MFKLEFALHDAAGHIGDTLAMVTRTLRQVGVFDGEAGDEIFGALGLARAAADRLRDNLDPALVSVVTVPRLDRPADATRGNSADLSLATTEAR